MAYKSLYLAGGCFWGLQELIRSEHGVVATEAGYAGGENSNPTYENHPGHAETVKVTYDDTATTPEAVLDYFFRIHDPTTKNRQGNDIGSSYRSTVFFETEAQRETAREMIARVDKAKLYDAPVVTTIEPLTHYRKAEEYHQDYLQKHPGGYTCHYVRSSTPINMV